jgi:hypothetical protein
LRTYVQFDNLCCTFSLLESGIDRAKLDVRVDDRRIRALAFNICRSTRSDVAVTTARSKVGVGVLISGVSRVEPQHVRVVIIPQGHDEDHALSKSLGHVGLPTLVLVGVSVFEDSLLLVTEFGRDRVTVNARNSGCRLRDRLSSLDIESLDLHSIASSDELSDNRELLGGVDSLTLAVEVLHSHTVAVEITAIRIAQASIAVGRVCSTTSVSIAASLLNRAASMGRHRRADGVGFPDIHLGTAGTVAADTSIGVVGRRCPTFDVALTARQNLMHVREWVVLPRR